jgi:hypothetical protein
VTLNEPLDEKHRSVAEAAGQILSAYGHAETSDSSRVVYTDGDLNIGRERDTIEIIYRGTLVFRHGPDCVPGECVFEEHGDWVSIVERIAQASSASPDQSA